jgi:ABC-type nitrate/sulfonate/bicarbonate transport system ATPase subunit
LQLLTSAWKAYGHPRDPTRKEVLRNFTLTVQVGCCTAIVAPNGSGKSTLVRAVLGIEKLDSGERAMLAADDLRSAVLQDYRCQLLPHASLKTNLSLPFRRNDDPNARTLAALECLGRLGYEFPLRRTIGELSGGQQQAVVVARALSASGKVMVWDEATSAMDYRRRRLLYELLWSRWASDPAPTVLLITHDVDEALLLAADVVVLDARLEVVDRINVGAPVAARTVAFLRSESCVGARERIRRVMLADPLR